MFLWHRIFDRQLSYRLYDRSNFVTGQTRLVMADQTSVFVMARCLTGHDRLNIRPCKGRIFDRSPF